MDVMIGKIFLVEKGKHTMRWKVIEHLYFPGQYSLVREFAGMMSYDQPSDYNHLCGCVTLENAYKVAYMLT